MGSEKRRRPAACDIPFEPDDETAYQIAEDGGKGDEYRAWRNLDRAKRRARSAVRDLAFSNDFTFFVTLTLDRQKVNRYDVAEITRKLNRWLDNHVRRNGLAYVLVAERHKDGAVHFHGFFNDALPVVDSGHTDPKGHTVYNLPAWDLGFTTAIRLYGDRHKAVGYVCKYITKAQEKIGGRWYYSGGALDRPEVTYSNVDFAALSDADGAYPFEIADIGAKALILDVGGENNESSDQASAAFGDVRDRSAEPRGAVLPPADLYSVDGGSDGEDRPGDGGGRWNQYPSAVLRYEADPPPDSHGGP